MSISKLPDIHSFNSNCNPHINNLIDYMVSKGIMMRNSPNDNCLKRVPVTLFPSAMPQHLFNSAIHLQEDISRMFHGIANDYEFLKTSLSSVIDVDSYTRRLWQIYDECHSLPRVQPIEFCLMRSDYMIEQSQDGQYRLRNIEYNTTSCAYAGFSQKISDCHRYINMKDKGHNKENAKAIPENMAADNFAKFLIEAWKYYENNQAVILFSVLDYEANVYDQRMIEYSINLQRPDIKIIYATMTELRKVKLIEGKLILNDYEIGIYYQRAGYDPSHLKCEEDWSARRTIEMSKVIKCPSLGYHLAGTKKVQQCLSVKGVLEKYVKNKLSAEHIRNTFAGLYTLDKSQYGDENIEMMMANPDAYVLKPQREGGGNNLYGEDIVTFLDKVRNTDERLAWIGMSRISPITQKNILLDGTNDEYRNVCEIVSELGVYGGYIGKGDVVIMNSVCGHLVRSKNVKTDEGGVGSGSSCLDSPLLIST